MTDTLYTPDYWIEKLQLQAHPEGGYFSETYRSAELVEGKYLPKRYGDSRSFSTAIYFLLKGSQFSALHRIKSDELWHFYTGSSLTVSVIEADGTFRKIKLGSNFENGETFQATVNAGCWFGSKVEHPDTFALVGCTVAPGFDFADFEMANRSALIRQYPQHQQLIKSLTHQ